MAEPHPLSHAQARHLDQSGIGGDGQSTPRSIARGEAGAGAVQSRKPEGHLLQPTGHGGGGQSAQTGRRRCNTRKGTPSLRSNFGSRFTIPRTAPRGRGPTTFGILPARSPMFILRQSQRQPRRNTIPGAIKVGTLSPGALVAGKVSNSFLQRYPAREPFSFYAQKQAFGKAISRPDNPGAKPPASPLLPRPREPRPKPG